jgi:steroid delta-isomerase-like uncharacterized protein
MIKIRLTQTVFPMDIISSYYYAFNNGDLAKFASLLDDNIIHDINQGKRVVGKREFLDFMYHMNSCYKESVNDLVVMYSKDGSRAAAEFTIHGTYLKTDSGLPEAKGQEYSLPVGAFFEIYQDRIIRVTNYYNLNDWLIQIEG